MLTSARTFDCSQNSIRIFHQIQSLKFSKLEFSTSYCFYVGAPRLLQSVSLFNYFHAGTVFGETGLTQNNCATGTTRVVT